MSFRPSVIIAACVLFVAGLTSAYAYTGEQYAKEAKVTLKGARAIAAKARAGKITDQELEKAKNIQLAGFYRQMKTINGRANALGSYEVYFGDYHKLFEAAEAYQKVTKEDIQRVANKYFGKDNRTVAIYTRKPGGAKPPEKGGKVE